MLDRNEKRKGVKGINFIYCILWEGTKRVWISLLSSCVQMEVLIIDKINITYFRLIYWDYYAFVVP